MNLDIKILDLDIKIYPHMHSDKILDQKFRENLANKFFLIEIKNLNVMDNFLKNTESFTKVEVSAV